VKFPYVQYDFAPNPRPIIPIRVEMDGQWIRYAVLVDSGSDANIFDRVIADVLGIDVESGEAAEMTGVTGAVQPFYFHNIMLQVGTHRVAVRAGFTDLSGKAYGVVGQRGFFDQFKVTFDLSLREIELTAHA
jgi:hypothetical protein